MSGKLCIGNLPVSATEAELQAKFEQFGRVLAVAIQTIGATGRNRLGLVELESATHAKAAIDRLNMTQYDDATISVYTARSDSTA